MKKILLPISGIDYRTSEKRLFNLAKGLSSSFLVEFLTISQDAFEDIKQQSSSCRNITVKLIEPESIPVSLDFRSTLVKVFIRYTYDVLIPGTTLKLWETAAFDDFWGHISSRLFNEKLNIDADIVLLPLLSYDDIPSDEVDVFYTSVISRAKDAGVKVAGYQLYPVFNGLKLMAKLMDAVIVKWAYERQFYVNMGIAAEDIYLLTDAKDKYSITSITDTFENYLYNDQIRISRDELGVAIFNHVKFRPFIRQIIKAVGDAKVPVVLSLVKRAYAVKDLHEDQIVAQFYLDDVKKTGCRYYILEPQSVVPVIMVSDVVISPTYVAPVELAARYGKKSIVYNPLCDTVPEVAGTDFINNPGDLSLALERAYKEKKMTVGMSDVVNAILGKSKVPTDKLTETKS